jgi:hypothetical protein
MGSWFADNDMVFSWWVEQALRDASPVRQRVRSAG